MQQFPQPSPERPALSDRFIEVMGYRAELFKRRGLSERCADAWACRLAQRDIDRDDRRLCLECSNYQRAGTCAVKLPKQKPSDFQKFMSPIPFTLQRCPSFNFQKP